MSYQAIIGQLTVNAVEDFNLLIDLFHARFS